MTFLIQQTLLYAVPLMIVALAGVFAERSGIINLALEGIMIIGAFVGAWFVRIMQESVWQESAAQGLLILASLAAVLALLSLTEALNPLVFFLGYMRLKVTAYLQPITHKLCNKLFHEVDPEPVSEEEFAAQEGEIPAGQ